MPHFAVTLVHGSAWNRDQGIRQQAGWAEHADFMDGLVTDGFILLGGPIGDGEETLHCVAARDEAEVRQRLAADPWARAGFLEVGAVRPWALWLDFRASAG
ncbi:MAG TPA: YciI family protein [Acidothermaceae bacterium]|jgi:uncharacterized protein YciI